MKNLAVRIRLSAQFILAVVVWSLAILTMTLAGRMAHIANRLHETATHITNEVEAFSKV